MIPNMKRPIIAAIVLLTAAFGANAQNSKEDSLRLAGCDYVYTPEMRKLTPAPKGYKPLTIQHYSRHGARYCWQSGLYLNIRDTLRKADSLGLLTPAGVRFRTSFERLYPILAYHEGELSRKGWEQHKAIAKVMYKSFPEVFKGSQGVVANSSNALRCVMSMASFCLSLSDCNPDLAIREVTGRNWYHGVIPNSRENPFARECEIFNLGYKDSPDYLMDNYYATEDVLSKLFTDPGAVVDKPRQADFVEDLYFFANGMQSIDTDESFSWIFTEEQRFKLWEIDNYDCYESAWNRRVVFLPILEDIIARGDAHIAQSRKGADLRFGHDTCAIPLMMLFGINGCDIRPERWEDVKDVFQNWNIPMGGNFQVIIYTSSRKGHASGRKAQSGDYREGEPLFKILLNGEEASLPAFKAVSGPYYRWADLKARAEDLHKFVK